MVRIRFAPAPSGDLHLGNARTALLNWLFCRHHKGHFLLRRENTDKNRSKKVYEESIQRDMLWLGLPWDDTFAQSDRQAIYDKAIQRLKKEGRLYPCDETPQALEQARQDSLAQKRPPVYDRASLHKPPASMDKVHWRFLLDHRLVSWNDLIQGEISYHTKHLSDPILIREDGSINYMLSSVADDHECQITHLIRGADHLTNTAIQIQIFQALGTHLPFFAHFPLMLDARGEKFSKRTGSLTLAQLREQGVFPLAICQVLAELGTAHQEMGNLADMTDHFSLTHYGKASGRFSLEKLQERSATLLRSMSHQEVLDFTHLTFSSELWDAIKNNVNSASDIAIWLQICQGIIPHAQELDYDFCRQALSLLPAHPWAQDTWEQWVTSLMQVCPQYKKSFILRHLRAALTGCDKGPPMKDVLPLTLPHLVRERLTKVN